MGLTIFILYALAMLAVGKYLGKSTASESSFYVNNRSSSAAMVAFSIVASCVGASATIGTVGLAFTAGTPAFWWLGSGAIGLVILGIFLARKVRKSRVYTLPEMLENRLGSKARRLISLIIVVAWASILAAQLVAASQVIQTLTALPRLFSLLAGALLILTHTILSGQSGVIRLDRIQCIVVLVGLILLVSWLAQSSSTPLTGPTPFSEIKLEAVNEQFPINRLLYFLLVLGGSYVVCPMLFGRVLSAKSETAAEQGTFWASLGLCFFSVLIVLIGLLARGLVPSGTPPDQVLTTLLATSLPAWLATAIYLALLSAIVSSADSCLITASLILARDLWQKEGIAPVRTCVIGLTVAGIGLTFLNKSILGFLLMANDVYVCGVVAPVFITILAGPNKKAQPASIMAGIILGGALGVLSSITGQAYFSYLAVAVSSLMTMLGFARRQAAIANV